jgi:hypothetical protein
MHDLRFFFYLFSHTKGKIAPGSTIIYHKANIISLRSYGYNIFRMRVLIIMKQSNTENTYRNEHDKSMII